MVFDHLGDNIFPEQTWMRIIGRIALPLFAFCISEGYIHTKDKKRYLKRLAVFALVSEIPFNLLFNGTIFYLGHQNVILTFFIAILSLIVFDKITQNKKKISFVFGTFIVILFGFLALILKTDYNFFAVSLVFIYCVFNNKGNNVRNVIGTIYQLLIRNVGIYIYGALSCIPIFLYNGKKGKGIKWLFYVFYPGHMLIIYLIRILIKG
jgi:hypothetical protein